MNGLSIGRMACPSVRNFNMHDFTPVIILFPAEHYNILYSFPIFNDMPCMVSFTNDLEADWKTR